MSRSTSANLPRGLHLILAPNELNLNLNGSHTGTFSPSPLPHGHQPPTPPEGGSANTTPPAAPTPGTAPAGNPFPNLARPPPPPPSGSGAGASALQPHPAPPSRGDSQPAELGGPYAAAERGPGGGVQLRNRPSAKEDGSWRRHLSLEAEPLGSLSATAGGAGGGVLGKSLSAQNLVQHGGADGPPAVSPGNSSDSSSGGPAHAGGDWGEAELFISDRDLDAPGGGFDFLSSSRQPSDPAFAPDLLRTGGRGSAHCLAGVRTADGSTESISMPHVRLK